VNLPQIHARVVLLFATVTLWPQGTVNLNNNFFPPGSDSKALVFGSNGQPLAKGAGRIEILDIHGNSIKEGPLAADGVFFLGVVEIPGTVPGGNGAIIIRAWEGPPGSTYESAIHSGSVIVTLVSLGGGVIPSPSLGTAGNFTGILIPPPIPPSAVLHEIQVTASGLEVHGEGVYKYTWALWASHNLMDWHPMGAPQTPQLGHPFRGDLRWTIPVPDQSAFFRIVIEQSP